MNKLSCVILLLMLPLTSCGLKTRHESLQADREQPSDTAIAVKFINEYTKECNGTNFNSEKWIESNELITDNFRTHYKQIFDDARKEDPEVGLAFDPIFNAQDYPKKGFDFLKSDDGGYITVKGKDWSEFTVVLKIIVVNNKPMVDGAGIVNIPEDRQP